jgi:predicted ATP-grasp superfamily ATP-dependent carboligase
MPPAVVTPLDVHMGVDIARSLGRRGIAVYGLDGDRATPGRSSRYVRFVHGTLARTSESQFIDALLALGRRLGRAVLFPLADDEVLAVSRHRDALQPYFDFVMSSHETVESLLAKDGLADIAARLDIGAPRTFVPADVEDVANAAHTLTFPVILKPSQSPYWHSPAITDLLREHALAGRAKVVVCRDPAELIRMYSAVAQLDHRLVVQEVVPGPDHSLVYAASYTARTGETIGLFVGRKIRVLPVGFGSASYVRSIVDEDATAVAMHLLKGAEYRGLGGIELKMDARDRRYKLIEFNVRFGMWDGLGAVCGVDLAHLAYRDAIGQRVSPIGDYREGVVWVDLQRDARAFLAYRRRGELSLRRWLRSLQAPHGRRVIATFARDDPMPGLASLAWLLAQHVRGNERELQLARS